jgi:SAM-dependent methyltransferase
MAKQGEVEYFRKLSDGAVRHALDKPFSDAECGRYLMEIGTLFTLLPPPPARLLDLGCGTCWTSCFFARRGYEVTGQDIAPDAIRYANRNKAGLANLEFVVSDYESLPYENAYDCAVFFDSLHHAVAEDAAIAAVYRALMPGGVCVASEPGRGHARSSQSVEAVRRFQVTEKDMPPATIIRLGKRAGFRSFQVFPHQRHLSGVLYQPGPGWRRLIRAVPGLSHLTLLFVAAVYKHFNGIVVMTK